MNTPVLQQLTGLLAFAKAQLRAHGQLTGSEDGEYAWTADEICKTIYPHKLFEQRGDNVGLYVNFGKVNAPGLAVYITESEATDVRGSSSGKTWPVGQECQLGIQYMFMARATDVPEMIQTAHFAQTIWEVLCNAIAADFRKSDSTLRVTHHIEEMSLGSMRLLPPFAEAVRAFEASATMAYKRPPWDTGVDSSQVVDLASIYTDHNEKGETGADPLVESIYTVPS